MTVLDSATNRIWDLRQGDADDNRTSPYGRGWRNVIVSTALEFNYLTASVSFLALVIVPALLVGLGLPLLVTYGRSKFDIARTVVSHPLAAVLSIALLIAVVVWVARPLLSVAIENLWHLHYTLVFPLFVGLRETISAVLEHFGGETRASVELDRRRRLGTVLAAILLAGGSLLVAWSIGVLAHPAIRDVVLQPWAVARAGLSNAAMVLSLSTAAASLYWLWREIGVRHPLRDWTPGPPISQAPTVRVAHLSDLHVVGERYGYRMESGTHGPPGNESLEHALAKLSAIHASTPLDCVLVSGDVTDAGTRAEWVEFLDVLHGYPEIRSRVLFVPGNHDVNIVDRTNTGRFDLPWSVGHALRRLRFVVALDDIQGEHLHVVDGASGAIGPSLREYLQDGNRRVRLRELAEQGTWRGRLEIARVWSDVFPLVLHSTEPGGCGVILDRKSGV